MIVWRLAIIWPASWVQHATVPITSAISRTNDDVREMQPFEKGPLGLEMLEII
jgi:hypothetical protein